MLAGLELISAFPIRVNRQRSGLGRSSKNHVTHRRAERSPGQTESLRRAGVIHDSGSADIQGRVGGARGERERIGACPGIKDNAIHRYAGGEANSRGVGNAKVARSVAPLGTVAGRPVGGGVPIPVRRVKVPGRAAGMRNGRSGEKGCAGKKNQGPKDLHSGSLSKMASNLQPIRRARAYGTTVNVRSFPSPPS